jgi:hypothetical protein
VGARVGLSSLLGGVVNGDVLSGGSHLLSSRLRGPSVVGVTGLFMRLTGGGSFLGTGEGRFGGGSIGRLDIGLSVCFPLPAGGGGGGLFFRGDRTVGCRDGDEVGGIIRGNESLLYVPLPGGVLIGESTLTVGADSGGGENGDIPIETGLCRDGAAGRNPGCCDVAGALSWAVAVPWFDVSAPVHCRVRGISREARPRSGSLGTGSVAFLACWACDGVAGGAGGAGGAVLVFARLSNLESSDETGAWRMLMVTGAVSRNSR